MPFGEVYAAEMARCSYGGDIWNDVHKTFGDGTVTLLVDTRETWAWEKVTTATNSDGTAVSVTKNDKEGKTSYSLQLGAISLDFTGDLRMGKNAEDNYIVYSSESGKTTIYNADGSVSAELDGDATADATNKIHIGTTGVELQGSGEDEMFFVLGDNTVVNCEAGNDTIVLPRNSYGARINAGDGNNTITGNNTQLFDATITAGDGDNHIKIDRILDTTLSLGDGNNSTDIGTVAGGKFIVGNGSNILDIGSILAANVNIGNGDNRIEIYDIKYNSTFNIGDGDNNVRVYAVGADNMNFILNAYRETGEWIGGTGRNSVIRNISAENLVLYDNKDSNTINFGDGDNLLHIYEVQNNGKINFGNGNNTAIIAEVINSDFSAGNGNNTISLGSMTNGSSAQIGNGNNYIVLHRIQDGSSANIGDGDNAIIVGMVSDNGSLTIGNGDNDITINDLMKDGSIFLGHGNNIVEVFWLRDDAVLSIGDGDNKIAVYNEYPTGSLILGSGDNSFYNNSSGSAFAAIREERRDSERPAILNAGDIFKNAKRKNPQTELMERVGMLSFWNAPKSLSMA